MNESMYFLVENGNLSHADVPFRGLRVTWRSLKIGFLQRSPSGWTVAAFGNPANSPVEVGRLSHDLRRVLLTSQVGFSRTSEALTAHGPQVPMEKMEVWSPLKNMGWNKPLNHGRKPWGSHGGFFPQRFLFCVFAKSQKDSLCWICLVCLRQVFWLLLTLFPSILNNSKFQWKRNFLFHLACQDKGPWHFWKKEVSHLSPLLPKQIGMLFSPSTVPGENMKCQFSVSAKNPCAILYPQGGEPTSHKWS